MRTRFQYISTELLIYILMLEHLLFDFSKYKTERYFFDHDIEHFEVFEKCIFDAKLWYWEMDPRIIKCAWVLWFVLKCHQCMNSNNLWQYILYNLFFLEELTIQVLIYKIYPITKSSFTYSYIFTLMVLPF